MRHRPLGSAPAPEEYVARAMEKRRLPGEGEVDIPAVVSALDEGVQILFSPWKCSTPTSSPGDRRPWRGDCGAQPMSSSREPAQRMAQEEER